MDVLSIPDPALRDPDAREMARIWIAEQELQCSLRVGTYHEADDAPPEYELWGRILSDMTQHIANAMHEAHGVNVEAFIDQVRKFYLQELSARHPGLEGGFVAGSH